MQNTIWAAKAEAVREIRAELESIKRRTSRGNPEEVEGSEG